jgi:thiol:disulfide interchange protein
MSTRRLSLIVVFVLFLGADFRPAFAGRPQPVHFSANLSPSTAGPGDKVTLTIEAAIDPGYHMYSVVSVPPPGPEQTTVTVTGAGIKTDGPLTESAPTLENDPNFGKQVGFHVDQATLTQRLVIAGTAKSGSLPLTVSVGYQACTATFCLPPTTVSVAVPPLTIGAGASGSAAPTTLGVIAAPSATSTLVIGAKALPTTTGAPAEDSGLGRIVVAGFLAGLLALLTPCVFPLIPVTFAFFTKLAQSGKGSLVALAGAYAVGIILCFTGIGGVFAAVFGAAGANRFAASPVVNLLFAALFLVFGLALLEAVEIRPPAFLTRLQPGRGGAAIGVLGVVGMGLTFVVAAFSCTAPFIGTILVAASTAGTGAQWVAPIVGMLSFSFALALPFFLLALFPGLLVRLPRSGAWLSTVKGAMGFLELAAALKFLSNVDLVYQWHLLTEPVLLAVWAMIALAGALYLSGSLRIGIGGPEGPLSFGRAAGMVAFLGASAVCLWGLSGRVLPGALAAFLPPSDYGAPRTGDAALTDGELPYIYDLDAGLAKAKVENKPIFIDFTGYTCTNCRWMEKNVFPTAPVRAALGGFIRIRLYTDGGPGAAHNSDYQETTFGTVALPLYAVLDSSGKPLANSVGITRDPDKFAAFLRNAIR